MIGDEEAESGATKVTAGMAERGWGMRENASPAIQVYFLS
jgi:hypothetical protein